MEAFLTGLDAWVWRYSGNTRNYPGLHFTAREPACEALIQCLDLLMAQGVGSRRAIPLRRLDPINEAKISGGQKFVDFHELVLQFSATTNELQQLSIGQVERRAVIEATPASVHRLRQGFEDVRIGQGDYAIAPDPRLGPLGTKDRASVELWFWPCFGHSRPGRGVLSTPHPGPLTLRH